MGVTDLSRKDCSSILSQYDLTYEEHEPLQGLSNANYMVHTKEDRYVLKLFEDTDPAEVRYALDVMHHVHERGHPVPRGIPDSADNVLNRWDDTTFVLYEFLPGSHPETVDKELSHKLGELLDELHRDLEKCNVGDGSWPPFTEMLDRFRDIKNTRMCEAIDTLRPRMQDLVTEDLGTGVVHGDLLHPNLLVEDDEITGVLDWLDAHRDFLVYDIAVLTAHVFTSRDEIHPERFRAFISAYGGLREQERTALYYATLVRLIGVAWYHERQQRLHPEKDLTDAVQTAVDEYKMLETMGEDGFRDQLF